MRRVRRFKDYGHQVWTIGSVALNISSCAWALVYLKEKQRRRLCWKLSTDPAVVDGTILRRIWDLILRIVWFCVSVNFQFAFSRCKVPRNKAANKATEQGNEKPQSYPAGTTDILTGVESQIRNVMYKAFKEGWMPHTHRRALLDHVRTPPTPTKLDHLGDSLLAQFRTGTSKHLGWLRRVLTRKTDQLRCRWCCAQEPVSGAAEECYAPESTADSTNALDLGIATR
ncbi:hypothetical protein DPX39_040087600 [Trypanosoma brucei equiperdum]|uniref:Uncharacterized protein n=1 Tax=Trypanosoma brucei equiperdum TaxID=630700 RepID=A0A3L6LAC9_9TRYP|nr:hypothetical protein DPX39_040087600 [Trypanosoma brucei equiperdum]